MDHEFNEDYLAVNVKFCIINFTFNLVLHQASCGFKYGIFDKLFKVIVRAICRVSCFHLPKVCKRR
jgi:hypothetical protein